MNDREAYLIAGIFFAILSLLSASGSVSLGTYQTPNSSGSYLVDNLFFELLAVMFSGIGMWFIYSAGKSTRVRSKTS